MSELDDLIKNLEAAAITDAQVGIYESQVALENARENLRAYIEGREHD